MEPPRSSISPREIENSTPPVETHTSPSHTISPDCAVGQAHGAGWVAGDGDALLAEGGQHVIRGHLAAGRLHSAVGATDVARGEDFAAAWQEDGAVIGADLPFRLCTEAEGEWDPRPVGHNCCSTP